MEPLGTNHKALGRRELTRAGRDAGRALLDRWGVRSFTDIPPEKRPEVFYDLVMLPDAESIL